jgi:predicted RNA-binding Zn-ribbon protein involved in translation (DUF1610 family)
MSRRVEIRITCPRCRNSQIVTAFTSVNVTLNPHLREKIFDDDLNRYKCPNCGTVSLIEIDLLYHDMSRKFAVWFCPKGDIPAEERKMLENLVQSLRLGEYLIKAPVTNSWDKFKSTILEFEEQEK